MDTLRGYRDGMNGHDDADDAQLQALGNARARVAQETMLKSNPALGERIRLGAPKAVTVEEGVRRAALIAHLPFHCRNQCLGLFPRHEMSAGGFDQSQVGHQSFDAIEQ